MTPVDAIIEVGQLFVVHDWPSSGSGPMSTGYYDFWEVVALTSKRVWVQKVDTDVVEYVPDADGIHHGGRKLRPVPGKYLTIKVIAEVVDLHGRQALRLPKRWSTRSRYAEPFDGKPVFFHDN